MAAELHFFYVLYCNDGSLYAGYTNDLQNRLHKHQSFKGAKYTRIKSKHPLKLIYAESWPSKSQAMAQEYYFKKLSRKQKEEYLQGYQVKVAADQSFVLVNREGVSDEPTTIL